MDHETALQSANQALSGGRRPDRSIGSVELQSMSTTLLSETGARAQPRARAPSMSSELWQLATMAAVAVATLSLVISLWLM